MGVLVGERHVGRGSGDRLPAALSVEAGAPGVCPGLRSVLREASSSVLFCHRPGMTAGVSKQTQGPRDAVRGQAFTVEVREQTQLGRPPPHPHPRHHTTPHPIPEDWSPAPWGLGPRHTSPWAAPHHPPQVLAGLWAPEGHVRRVRGDLMGNQD